VLVDDNSAIGICSLTIQPKVKKSAFFLVVHPDQAVAELMAECPKCGAITTYGLELAWRAPHRDVQRMLFVDAPWRS